MTTEPRLCDSGDRVIPFGVCTKSRNHKEAQLLCRLLPNSKIGPILSVRAFEFASMYGVDVFNPAEETTNSWDHRSQRQPAFLQATRFRRCFKRRRRKVTEYLRQRTEYCLLTLEPMLHDEGNFMQFETAILGLTVSTLSQRADEDARSRGKRCVLLGKAQDPLHRRHANHEGRLYVQLVGEIDEIHR